MPVTYMWYSELSFMPGLESRRLCVDPVAERRDAAI
jgi:hypothetical protein